MFLCGNYGHPGPNHKNFCFCCPSELVNLRDKSDAGWEEKIWKLLELQKVTGKETIFPIEPERCATLPLHLVLGLTKTLIKAVAAAATTTTIDQKT